MENLKKDFWLKIFKDKETKEIFDYFGVKGFDQLFSNLDSINDQYLEDNNFHVLLNDFLSHKTDIKIISLSRNYSNKNASMGPIINKLVSYFFCKKTNLTFPFKKCFIDTTTKFVYELSIQSLILELQILKIDDKLIGKNENERYIYFEEKFLKDITWQKNFFLEYPLILIKLKNKINNFRTFLESAQKNLDNDRIKLEDKFNFSCDLREVRTGGGDFHNNLQTTLLFDFSNGSKLYYKPRKSINFEIYNDIINLINKSIRDNTHLIHYNYITIDEHSWEEYIENEPIYSKEQLKRYYYRYGKISAILYLLGAVDFHHENVIAKNEFPILIDSETLVNENLYVYKDSRVPLSELLNRILQNSIQKTGLIPFKNYFGDNIDISGLGGINEQTSKNKDVMKLSTGKSDNMKFVKDYFSIKREKNIPNILSSVNPSHYAQSIVDGFRTCYLFFKKDKNLQLILEKYKNKIEFRSLIRNSQEYSEFIFHSNNPDNLKNYVENVLFLLQLSKKNHINSTLFHAEINSLYRGEIPYFKKKLTDNSIHNIKYYNLIKEKLNNLSFDDLKIQEQIIQMSITNTYEANHYSDYYNPKLFLFKNRFNNYEIKDMLLKRIADIYSNLSIQNSNEVSWLISNIYGKENLTWDIEPVNYSLYDGLAGIGLFFLYYNNINETPLLTKIIYSLKIHIISMIKSKDLAPNNIGAFTGTSGILYVLSKYYLESKDNEVIEILTSYAELLKDLLYSHEAADFDTDIIGGLSGVLLVSNSIYKNNNISIYKDISIKIFDLIYSSKNAENLWKNHADDVTYTGFAHGYNGILYALVKTNKLYDLNYNSELYSIALKIIKSERKVTINHNISMYEGAEKTSFAWCHGLPGILLTKQILSQEFRIPIPNSWFKSIYEDSFGKTSTLCHGDIGNLIILNKIALDNNVVNDQNEAYETSLLNKLIETRELQTSRGISSLGLMAGMAGIGYYLMLDNKEINSIPFVLTLD